jgi:hypothetical protein
MGLKLKRAEKLGIWYPHDWIWEPSRRASLQTGTCG